MPRLIERLSQKKIDRLKKAVERGIKLESKRHADGNGLYLQTPEVSWISLFRFQGKRHERLGPLRGVSLEAARAKNKQNRDLLAAGINPLFQRATRRARAATSKTFKEAAAAYIKSAVAKRGNPKHSGQWTMTLLGETGTLDAHGHPIKSAFNYCRTLHYIPVSDISHDFVLDVLRPIWETKHVTAKRLRGRIEQVLGWAGAQGMAGHVDPNTYINPARWNGPLKHALSFKRVGHPSHLQI